MPSPDDPTVPERSLVTTFDPGDERASVAVLEAVAALADEDPARLEPLHDAVNPDALDALVSHADRRPDANERALRFPYLEFDVRVTGAGEIRVTSGSTTVERAGDD